MPTDTPASTSRPRPRLATAYPQLHVTDIARSVDFYVQTLGFREVYRYGKPPFYALVERDGAGLNLRHVDAPLLDQSFVESESLIVASIPTYGIDQLYAEIQAHGAPLAQPMTKQPWGAKDFIVRDPDGNLICFGEATA
ncbi:MAG: bleomycin resistance protein [Hyphomicrobiaceae bacterium]